jgi:YebC/PmpR family DNA-binding regulatory protein
MSGHSKWATIKHKKGAADKARGKLFNKLARQLEVAARAGGGDADANPTLRTAVQKAKAAQMTNDAIDRAIKRGTGEGDTGTYESIMYEAYAPGGVAVLIDVLTDNRNRTGSEIRGVFTRHGGSLAEPGAVSWQFARRGIVMVDGSASEDDLMMAALDAGADDVADDGGTWRVTTDPSLTFDVRDALEAAGFAVESADSPMVSDTLVPITTVEEAKKVLRVVELIEDNDDVQDVYANFDIPEDVSERRPDDRATAREPGVDGVSARSDGPASQWERSPHGGSAS